MSTLFHQSKSMRTHATRRIGETSLQNCQKTKESLGNIGIFLLLKPIFPHMKFDFLQRLSTFFNGFLLSSTAFWFSSTAFRFSSTAFNFPRNPRKSIYGKKYTRDHYLSLVFFATRSPTCSPSFVIPATIPNTLLWCTCVPNSAPYLKSKLKYNPSRI